MIGRRLHLVLLALGVAAAAQAQQANTPRQPADQPAVNLTLEDALTQGLANSQRLAELEARQAGTDAVVRERQAADRPEASLLAGYSRTNHVDEFAIAIPGGPRQVVYPDVPDNYRTRLDLQWPIYSGGQTDALTRAARAEREASAQDLGAARADLRLEIIRAYWALGTARETEDVLSRSIEAIDAQVRDLQTRLDQGFIPPNDLLSAQAQAARQRLLATEALNTRRIAEADLRRLTGIEAAGTLVPSAPLGPSVEPAATDSDVAALIGTALTKRADRRALQSRVASAEARTSAAGASARPQVSVGAGYDYARPNPRIFPRSDRWEHSWDASINLSWSLWDGGRRAASVAEATANTHALQARLGDLDRQVTFEVRQRYFEAQSSHASVPAVDEEVRAAVEAERVVNERYRAGVATATDVLDAQVARLQAELDRTRTLAAIRLAEARLARATGDLQ